MAKTQAQVDRFVGRELVGTVLAPVRLLREIRDKFSRERDQYRVRLDLVSSYLADSTATLTGAKPGVNMTPAAEVYVRISGSGPYTVAFHMSTGGADKVAEGSGSAGATVTLTEQNSSGLGGTWKLPGSPATTSGDELVLELHRDFPANLPRVYTQEDGIDDDVHSARAIGEGYTQVADAIQSAINVLMGTTLARFLLSDGRANPIARGNSFLDTGETSLITDTAKSSGGVVVRKRGGYFTRLSEFFTSNSPAQTILERDMAGSAATFDATGQGSVASHTPRDKALVAKLYMFCVKGVDTNNLGEEEFSGYLAVTTAGKERRIPCSGLVVGKRWSGPNGIGEITLARTWTKTNDGSDENFADPSSSPPTVVGLNNGSSENGVWNYRWTDEGGGSSWTLEIFKSATLHENYLVAKATGVTDGADFVATEENSSGVQIDWTAGSNIGATNLTGQLNANPFQAQNANGRPDKFTIDFSVNSGTPGLIATLLAEEIPQGADLPGTTSGSETIEDGYVKAGTFPDYLSQDN